MNRRSKVVGAVAALVLVAGCDAKESEKEAPRPSYVKPVPHASAETTCASIKADRAPPSQLVLGAGGTLMIGDAATIGGPFESPILVPARPGPHAVSVWLTNGAPTCARVDIADGTKAATRSLGTLVIDSDIAAIADAPLVSSLVAHAAPVLYAGLEGPAASLATVLPTLPKDLALEAILPTLARSTRPIAPTDEATIRSAIQRARVGGTHFVAEPIPFAEAFVNALDEKPVASVRLGENDAAAIAIAAKAGAYHVIADVDGAGVILAVELRLFD